MLTSEIRKNWESDSLGCAQPIASLAFTEYPAWTVRFPDSYGVAILYNGSQEINEKFSNACIYSSKMLFNNDTMERVLLLTTQSRDIVASFSALCAELIDPGMDGAFRREILESPVNWWREWKDLLGNKNIEDRVYDVLGELCVLDYLIASGEDASWNGPSGASYDIETDKRFVEVKSSVVRGRKEITISSEYQMDTKGKVLDLIFCQFEPSISNGISINKIVAALHEKGLNIGSVNEKLKTLGFEEGRSSRNKTFILHNMLKYAVDDNFPRITPEAFIGGVLPAGIVKVRYTVDLSGMVPETLMQEVGHDI